MFTVIFLLECIIKITAMGFIRSLGEKAMKSHQAGWKLEIKAYINDYWNCIDFVIVLISMMSMTPWANQDSLKAFRTARVMRPLRSIQTM